MIIVTGFSNTKIGALKYQQLAFVPNNSIAVGLCTEQSTGKSGRMTRNLPRSRYPQLKRSASLGGITHLSASEGHAACCGLYVCILLHVSCAWERFHTSAAELLLLQKCVVTEGREIFLGVLTGAKCHNLIPAQLRFPSFRAAVPFP